jgi:CXXX repeat modification system protein
MEREIIGTVTREEKNELMVFFERKIGIEELTASLESDLLSLDKKENIQNKMIDELGKVNLNLQAWWNKMYEKYNWKSIDGYKWSIDFQTCEIFFTK